MRRRLRPRSKEFDSHVNANQFDHTTQIQDIWPFNSEKKPHPRFVRSVPDIKFEHFVFFLAIDSMPLRSYPIQPLIISDFCSPRLFGVLARRVAAADHLLTPADVCNTMVQELNRPAMKGWVGLNTQVSSQKLDACRSWKNHFTTPQQVYLRGGLLEDSSANHCFIFMLRRGLGL